METSYYCYWIQSKEGFNYVGITNNLINRLRKHNKEISGGAKATRKGSNWSYQMVVGSLNKSDAGSLEYYWKKKRLHLKHPQRLDKLLCLEKFEKAHILSQDELNMCVKK